MRSLNLTLGLAWILIDQGELTSEYLSTHVAACNNCSDESVHVLPNKDSTSVGRVPENAAKSDRKKGNICPSPVSDFNKLGDDPHTSPNCYCVTQSNRFWSQLARQAAPGSRSGWRTSNLCRGGVCP